MNRYPVPPDTSEKEKIFGGWFSFYQVIWLGGGLVLGALVFIALFNVMGKAALIIGIPVMLSGVPFAYIKKEGLPLFDYLWKLRKHRKEQHLFPNKRNIK